MLQYRFSCSDVSQWISAQFGSASVSDRRRQRRVHRIAEGFARAPGKSIPQLFARKYEVDAAYALFHRPEATPDNLQAGHRAAVREAARAPGSTVLFIEDTSEMSWSGHEPIEGLGPVGSGEEGLQGFLLHSVVAARWSLPGESSRTARRPPVEVLGLADQQYHIRQPRPAHERRTDARARTSRPVESQLWEQASQRLGTAPPQARWVRVADRGADLYEFLISCQAMGHGYTLRAAQDRVLVEEATGHAGGSLFAALRAQEAAGDFDLPLRARPGQEARVARLSVSFRRVLLRSPQRPGHGPGALAPIACTAVRVWEAHPPAGLKQPLEWILLTDVPLNGFDAAQEVALQYSARWLIEDFHHALKTGLRAEDLQLERAERLFAAIAIMAVVALRLIDLREHVRLHPEAPAQHAGLSDLELSILRLRWNRPVTTVRDVALALGRLGGHMNRKSDGMPGWLTLWRGMRDLEMLVQGVQLAKLLPRSQV